MTPQVFVEALDRWSAAGGELPRLGPHDVSTVAEAQALCRAVASPHIEVANAYGTLALFDLMDFFRRSETREAMHYLREHGLPVLRRIVTAALEGRGDGENPFERRSALLFVVKVIAAYQQADDAALIVRAARDPDLAQGFLWPTSFGMIAERHPAAVQICERLSDPLPDDPMVRPYLDFANRLAGERAISGHPFDNAAGLERLSAFLAERDVGDDASAISATACIPFLAADRREPLLERANAHPAPLVRLEAAWAMACADSLAGHRHLIEFCRDPRFSTRATMYLEELGMAKLIPPETQAPDFRAMSLMCRWLAHPMEFGRPPDAITLYDTRELDWPPTDARERLWLFKYGYRTRESEEARAGIGLVGPVTFALSNTTPDLSPEDVYGLHCSWELRWNEDPRAPKEPSAAAGRKLIADLNPGFPRA